MSKLSSKEQKIKKSSKIWGMHASSEWIQGSSMTHLRTRTQLPLNLKNSGNHSGKDALMICWKLYLFWTWGRAVPPRSVPLYPGSRSRFLSTSLVLQHPTTMKPATLHWLVLSLEMTTSALKWIDINKRSKSDVFLSSRPAGLST